MVPSQPMIVNTGDPRRDQELVRAHFLQFEAQGIAVHVSALASGGFQLSFPGAGTSPTVSADPARKPVRGPKGTVIIGTLDESESQRAAPAAGGAGMGAAYQGVAGPSPLLGPQAVPPETAGIDLAMTLHSNPGPDPLYNAPPLKPAVEMAGINLAMTLPSSPGPNPQLSAQPPAPMGSLGAQAPVFPGQGEPLAQPHLQAGRPPLRPDHYPTQEVQPLASPFGQPQQYPQYGPPQAYPQAHPFGQSQHYHQPQQAGNPPAYQAHPFAQQYQQPAFHGQPPQHSHSQQGPAPLPGSYGQAQSTGQPPAPAPGSPIAGAGPAPWAAGAVGLAATAVSGGPAWAVPVAAPVAEALGIDARRVEHLRKVYSLLLVSLALAIMSGFGTLTFGGTVPMVSPEGLSAEVPFLVSLLLGSRLAMNVAFGVLFLGTLAASAVSRIRILNVVALFGVSVIMGAELAPMIFVAEFYAGLGATLSNSPVRDTSLMVSAVFVGCTAYVFLTKKNFSYLGSLLSIGFFLVLGGCVLSFVFRTELVSLLVATAGSVLAAGYIIYVTWRVLRSDSLDDPVGDALSLLVQLRNLFMFLLRIFMSRR